MKYAYRPLLPGISFLEYGNFEHLELINNKTAGVVIEPVQAEAGIIIPSHEYIKAVRQKCDETGAMLILDEIQMGFGRTGKLFAFEHFSIIPDILCIAKAMGGGMPIGAFVSSRENMDTLKHNPALGHITTFGGHPVSAAAAHASLCVILEEKLIQYADYKGKLFADNLSAHPEITEIRQIGLMLGVELKNAEKANTLMNLFLDKGMIVDQFLFNQLSFRIAPPLNITVDEINTICGKIITCLDRLLDK
jgi:acetylornithine/succinyldiaminopimelate/putrescine aminotransferase